MDGGRYDGGLVGGGGGGGGGGGWGGGGVGGGCLSILYPISFLAKISCIPLILVVRILIMPVIMNTSLSVMFGRTETTFSWGISYFK